VGQTAYFFCGFAFTALGRTRDLDDPARDSFFVRHVLDHFQRHYYRMGVVPHYQRAALLYFADEMATAAKMLARRPARRERGHQAYRDRLRRVQLRFLKFQSRSYFPEITNHPQGAELNRLWHTHLGIPGLFGHVDDTCDQINEVFAREAAERLGRFAAFGLPVGLGLALLSVLFAGEFLPKYADLGENSDGRWDWANAGGSRTCWRRRCCR
jgi:hypothetical protein